MFEELYLEYEMKYRDSMKKEVEKMVRAHDYETARGLLIEGVSVETLERGTRVPRDDLLRMKAELDEKRPDGSN